MFAISLYHNNNLSNNCLPQFQKLWKKNECVLTHFCDNGAYVFLPPSQKKKTHWMKQPVKRCYLDLWWMKYLNKDYYVLVTRATESIIRNELIYIWSTWHVYNIHVPVGEAIWSWKRCILWRTRWRPTFNHEWPNSQQNTLLLLLGEYFSLTLRFSFSLTVCVCVCIHINVRHYYMKLWHLKTPTYESQLARIARNIFKHATMLSLLCCIVLHTNKTISN